MNCIQNLGYKVENAVFLNKLKKEKISKSKGQVKIIKMV